MLEAGQTTRIRRPMSDLVNSRPGIQDPLIDKIVLSETLIFDVVPDSSDTTLEMCGKCGTCGVSAKSKVEKLPMDKQIEILRQKIEKNPEILKDVNTRFNLQ
jgi:hypothetical protein